MRRSTFFAAIAATCAFVAASASASVRTIDFGPGRTLSGELDKPPGRGPFPLAVLIPAGGGIDRNGTSNTLSAFDDIYLPLVKVANDAGFALFRYDRQGTGHSRPSDRSEVADAIDAVGTALQLPDVDPSRVVLIAHASGTSILAAGYNTFERVIGFSSLKGVVLLSSNVRSQVAGRMAGDLLVVIGESDGNAKSSITAGAVSVHKRTWPDKSAEAIVIPGADHALCDTTVADWHGWGGPVGSCRLPPEVYRAVGSFLKSIGK